MTLTLDRPADQNRLARDVLLTLHGIVDRLGADEEIQAVVVTGSGSQVFSLGIEWSRDVGEGTAAHREWPAPRFTGR